MKPKKERFRLMQVFVNWPPPCDRRDCLNRARGFYSAPDGRAWALCEHHIRKAAKQGTVDLDETAYYEPGVRVFPPPEVPPPDVPTATEQASSESDKVVDITDAEQSAGGVV